MEYALSAKHYIVIWSIFIIMINAQKKVNQQCEENYFVLMPLISISNQQQQ